MKKIASSLLLFFISSLVFSQVSADYTVRVSATYTESPATITLQWPVKATAIEYLIYKKAKEESNWGSAIATLDAAATSFTDNDVIIDSLYEYKIYCSNTGGINSFGYILAGIKVHATHYRGSCLLVVDTTITSSMENELYRLMQDISCLLYTSDAADERSSVDLGGRRIIKKKKNVRYDVHQPVYNTKDKHNNKMYHTEQR